MNFCKHNSKCLKPTNVRKKKLSLKKLLHVHILSWLLSSNLHPTSVQVCSFFFIFIDVGRYWFLFLLWFLISDLLYKWDFSCNIFWFMVSWIQFSQRYMLQMKLKINIKLTQTNYISNTNYSEINKTSSL